MVKFLPLILEKLIGLIVSPPLLNGQLLKCTSVAFDCLVSIVGTFTVSTRNIYICTIFDRSFTISGNS